MTKHIKKYIKIYFQKYIFLLSVIAISLFYSESTQAKEINYQIEISGNQRLGEDIIKSYLNINKLKNGDLNIINQSLKILYETDLFNKVNIEKEDNKIIIKVTENPIIKDIIFSGNKKIDDDILLDEINLKKRSNFTKSKIESDIKRINNIYIKSGRFLTKIDPQIKQEEQNRITLIFKISENKKAKIKDIQFTGNNNFSNQDLLDEITTKKSKWYKFFSSSDSYDSDRVEFDKEKLRIFYNSKGYADFHVILANAQINKTKDGFFLNFLIEEGIKYNFGKISITNNIKKFDKDLLRKHILTKEGKIYNANLIDNTIDKFTDILSENSYAFTKINPVITRNKQNKTIDLEYVLQETPRIYINEINISGNNRTLEEVIRRELRVREGDPYNISKINRSKQRINNLGFFERVNFKTNRIGNSNKINIEIEVKEKKTGELNFGIGYSSVDRATGNIGIKERNLFGTGQELSINTQKSYSRFNNQLNYTKPWFMGREISVGVDLFNSQLGKLDTLVYDQNSEGISFRAGYAVLEHVNHFIKYSYKDENISNVADSASQTIRNLEGQFVNSSISHSINLDKRDNRFEPSEGYFMRLSQTYAGVGGDIKYFKQEGNANYYIPFIDKKFILKFSGRFGHIDGIGQDVKSNDNFILGGNSFRGFEYAGLGPRAINSNGSAINGDAIGGKTYYVSTTELKFPLGLPKEVGINASLFHEIGTLKSVDNINKENTEIADSGSLRSSYGLSIIWSSPMGPIRLDFSKIAKAEKYDRTENFRFSFGSSF